MTYNDLIYIYWLVAVLLTAKGQAKLLPALRTLPPAAPEALNADDGLHSWLLLAYFAPLLLVWWLPVVWWKWLVAAMVARLLFDPALSLFSGTPLLYVGQTAASDRLLRRLAPLHPERLALVLRVVLVVSGLVPLFIW